MDAFSVPAPAIGPDAKHPVRVAAEDGCALRRAKARRLHHIARLHVADRKRHVRAEHDLRIARLREVSFEALPGTPEDMTAAARKERELWKKVVEMSGAKAD